VFNGLLPGTSTFIYKICNVGMCNVNRILNVGMLITATLSSLAAPLKLSFPVVILQISSVPNFTLKFRDQLSMRYLRYQICTLMFYNQSLFVITFILS